MSYQAYYEQYVCCDFVLMTGMVFSIIINVIVIPTFPYIEHTILSLIFFVLYNTSKLKVNLFFIASDANALHLILDGHHFGGLHRMSSRYTNENGFNVCI